jgi:hypothetical protein
MLPLQAQVLRRAVLLVCLLPSLAWAQASSGFVNRCAEWIAKKGHSADYIEQRTGQRPRGNVAADWRANLEPANVKPGDVVSLSSSNSGQRAEVVDEVLRAAAGALAELKTSSMNNGKMLEPSCQITVNFGKVTQRVVTFAAVMHAWRPD